MEQPTAEDQRLGGRLNVQDAASRCHPLGGAVGDETAAAVGVLVLEGALEDVGDGLEAAVGVPVGALGFVGGVVDLAQLVHVDEGVEVAEIHAGEGPPDREPLALKPARGGQHGPHRPSPQAGIEAQFGQGGGVSSDGSHRRSSDLLAYATINPLGAWLFRPGRRAPSGKLTGRFATHRPS